MQVRTIALAAAALAVLAALVVLFFQARAAREIVIPEQALAGALARYERARAAPPAEAVASRPAPEAPAARAAAPRRAPAARPALRPPTAAREQPETSPEAPDEAQGAPPERIRRPARAAEQPRSELSAEDVAQRRSVREAYIRGDYRATLELTEDMLRQDPDNTYLRRLAAMSACGVGDAETAREHQAALSAVDQRFVAARCREHGLEL